MITKAVLPLPVPHTDTYIIDGSCNSIEGIHGPDSHQSFNTSFSSSQHVELGVLIYLFWVVHKSLNIVSISA